MVLPLRHSFNIFDFPQMFVRRSLDVSQIYNVFKIFLGLKKINSVLSCLDLLVRLDLKGFKNLPVACLHCFLLYVK